VNYFFTSKNFNLDNEMKNFVIEKFNKHLAKFLPEKTNINISFREVNYQKKIKVMISLGKRTMRAEVTDLESMHAAVDTVIDILRKQIRRYKSRMMALAKKNNEREEFDLHIESDQKDINIERVKSFAFKPMNIEEATLELELLSYDFYVFLNSDTNEVNVIYKRKNNSYGLIEPINK